MSDEDTGGWSLMDEPFAFAIFPIICLVIAVFVASVLYTRRRRLRMATAQNGHWPQDYTAQRHGLNRPRRSRGVGNRWGPWNGTRNDEGLNELGEAPPPYDGKREDAHRADEVELRDLEMNRPPHYLNEPGPAMTRDARQRWG